MHIFTHDASRIYFSVVGETSLTHILNIGEPKIEPRSGTTRMSAGNTTTRNSEFRHYSYTESRIDHQKAPPIGTNHSTTKWLPGTLLRNLAGALVTELSNKQFILGLYKEPFLILYIT